MQSGRRAGFACEAIECFACEVADDCGSCARMRGALKAVGAVHQGRLRVQGGAPAPSRRRGCQERGSRCARAGRIGYSSKGGRGECARHHFYEGDERTRKCFCTGEGRRLLTYTNLVSHRLTSHSCRRYHGRTCTTISPSSRTAFQKYRRCRKRRTRTEHPALRARCLIQKVPYSKGALFKRCLIPPGDLDQTKG